VRAAADQSSANRRDPAPTHGLSCPNVAFTCTIPAPQRNVLMHLGGPVLYKHQGISAMNSHNVLILRTFFNSSLGLSQRLAHLAIGSAHLAHPFATPFAASASAVFLP
jgi:hypothetical protein